MHIPVTDKYSGIQKDLKKTDKGIARGNSKIFIFCIENNRYNLTGFNQDGMTMEPSWLSHQYNI